MDLIFCLRQNIRYYGLPGTIGLAPSSLPWLTAQDIQENDNELFNCLYVKGSEYDFQEWVFKTLKKCIKTDTLANADTIMDYFANEVETTIKHLNKEEKPKLSCLYLAQISLNFYDSVNKLPNYKQQQYSANFSHAINAVGGTLFGDDYYDVILKSPSSDTKCTEDYINEKYPAPINENNHKKTEINTQKTESFFSKFKRSISLFKQNLSVQSNDMLIGSNDMLIGSKEEINKTTEQFQEYMDWLNKRKNITFASNDEHNVQQPRNR